MFDPETGDATIKMDIKDKALGEYNAQIVVTDFNGRAKKSDYKIKVVNSNLVAFDPSELLLNNYKLA